MKLITAPSGHRFLMVWRTEFLFYTSERRRLAEEWNHVRLTSADLPEKPSLINHALDKPLPFAGESFDAIYGFHVNEHLSPRANERFMRDLHRLVKPGGICRISTPDLELLASDYLQRLHEQMASCSPENYARYRWAVCNLIDQSTREVSGGEMLNAIRGGEIDPEHVKQVNGDLLHFLFPPTAPRPPARLMSIESLKKPALFLRKLPKAILRRLRPRLSPKSYLELIHERNLWLFDRISLSRLFAEAGFQSVSVMDHRTSGIPEWNRYNFDQSAFGDYPLEPSLYMEGVK
jgi:predicted SAM-dependent methyltransferase